MIYIETRYQYWSSKGIVWTDWFESIFDVYEDEQTALQKIKSYPKTSNRLKREWRIVSKPSKQQKSSL